MEQEVQFRKIYMDYWDLLYRIANKKTGSEEDALDLVQETFAYVWQQFADIKITEDKVRSYLITCLYYRLLTYFRARGLSQKHKAFFRSFIQQNEAFENPHYDKHEAEEEQAAIEIAINGALEQMPVRMRNVFIHHQYENQSVSEIAASLSISEKTVRNQMSSAKKRLKEMTRSHYPLAKLTPILLFWKLFLFL